MWSRRNCLVIVTSSANRLWRHQQNENWASETQGDVQRSSFLLLFLHSLRRVRNKMMYAHSWRTVYALTRVLFWCLFPSLLRNTGNKHQNKPLMSAETICHSSVYIILYISWVNCKQYTSRLIDSVHVTLFNVRTIDAVMALVSLYLGYS